MSPNNYFKPTPKKVKKIALAIKGFCATVAGSALMTQYYWVTITALIVGGLANEIAEFYSDEDSNNSNNGGSAA